MKLATALWATLAVLLAATVRAQCPASFSALAPSVLPLGGGVELSFVVSPPAQAALVTAVFVAGAACSSLQTNATDGRVSCIAPDGSSSSDRYVPVNVNEAAPGSGSCNSTGLEAFYASVCAVEGQYARPEPDGSVSCQPCPEGGQCPGGPRLYAQTGYWTPGPERTPVRCVDDDRCLGGREGCAAGYRDFACGNCDKGYFISGSSCSVCQQSAGLGLVFFAEFMFIAALIAAVAFTRDKTLGYVIDCLVAMQVLQGVGNALGASLPGSVVGVFRFLRLVNLDLQFLRYLSCGQSAGIAADPSYEFYFASVMGTILATILLMQAASRVGQLLFPHRFMRVLITNSLLWYYGITFRAIEGVFCIRVGGELYLQASPGTKCYEGAHLGVAVPSFIVLFCYTFLYPVLMFRDLYRARHRLDQFGIKVRYGFLYDSFRPEHRFFGASWFLVALSISSVSVIFRDDQLVRFLLFLVTFIIHLSFVVVYRPFRIVYENFVLISVLVVSIVGTSVDFMGTIGLSVQTRTVRIFAIIFMVLTCAVVVFYLISFARFFFRWLIENPLCVCMDLAPIDDELRDRTDPLVQRRLSFELAKKETTRRLVDGTNAASVEAVTHTAAVVPRSASSSSGASLASADTPRRRKERQRKSGADGGGTFYKPSPFNLSQQSAGSVGQAVYRKRSASFDSSAGSVASSGGGREAQQGPYSARGAGSEEQVAGEEREEA